MSGDWPTTRDLLGQRRTLRSLFDLLPEALSEAFEAAVHDLYSHGATEACARALAAAKAFGGEKEAGFFDSELALTFAMPVLLRGAYLRSLYRSGAHGADPRTAPIHDEVGPLLRDRYSDLGELDPDDDFKLLLERERELEERRYEVRDLDQRYYWIDPSDDLLVLERAMVAAAARPVDFSSPLRSARYAAYWVRVLDRLHDSELELQFARSPWDLATRYEPGDSSTRPAVVDALGHWQLDDAAAIFRAATERTFVSQTPPTWEAGAVAVRRLMSERYFGDALQLLERMEPELFESEITAALPALPDEYEERWGSIEDWNRAVDARNEAASLQLADRRVWRATQQAIAYQKLGDLKRAFELVPKYEDAVPLKMSPETEGEWRSVLFYLKGWHDGHEESATKPDGTVAENLAALVESARRIEREMYRQGLNRRRVEETLTSVASSIEALNELILDLPASVSAQLHEDWKADAEFELRSRALLRGWRAISRAERNETPRLEAEAAVGKPAWERLGTESRDDLIAWRLISDPGAASILRQRLWDFVAPSKGNFGVLSKSDRETGL